MSTIQSEKFQIHNYDSFIKAIIRHITTEFSSTNSELILKYDKVMVRESLAKATRRKHLEMLLSLTRFLKKDWQDVTKDDVEELVYQVMLKYSPETGQETNSTWDHKKVLKIFFRWFKLGSRQYRVVGDPDEKKNVRLREVKSKIIREDLINKQLIRFEHQRSRLMRTLDTINSIQENNQIERLIFDIDSKLTNISLKIQDSKSKSWDLAIDYINKWMKDITKTTVTYFVVIYWLRLKARKTE